MTSVSTTKNWAEIPCIQGLFHSSSFSPYCQPTTISKLPQPTLSHLLLQIKLPPRTSLMIGPPLPTRCYPLSLNLLPRASAPYFRIWFCKCSVYITYLFYLPPVCLFSFSFSFSFPFLFVLDTNLIGRSVSIPSVRPLSHIFKIVLYTSTTFRNLTKVLKGFSNSQ